MDIRFDMFESSSNGEGGFGNGSCEWGPLEVEESAIDGSDTMKEW